jgi:hypothetical protein
MTSFVPRTLADGRICCSTEYARCAACTAHFAKQQEDHDYTPPSSYTAALAARYAAAHETTSFSERNAAARLREFEAEWQEES